MVFPAEPVFEGKKMWEPAWALWTLLSMAEDAVHGLLCHRDLYRQAVKVSPFNDIS